MTLPLPHRVLVTGASRGSGLDLARGLDRAGVDIVLSGRDAQRLAALRSDMPDPSRVRALAFDVTSDENCAEALTWCMTNWPPLNAVVHAVSADATLSPLPVSQDALETALRVLLSGTLNVVRAAAREGIGSVIVIAPPGNGYASTSLAALVEALAQELRGRMPVRLLRADEASIPSVMDLLHG